MVLFSQKNITRESLHRWVYFFCLCLLVISIPTSRSFIVVSQVLLGINWLAEGQFKTKLNNFFNNKPAIAFSLIYVLYIIGLLWTENLAYGINSELKTSLPILTLTLVISTSPSLDIKKIRIILFLFIAAVLSVSFIGLYIYLTKDNAGFRDITPFASHLYFSMMLIISAFLLPWLARQITNNKLWLITSYSVSAWMIIFVFITRSLSGLVSLIGVLFFLMAYVIVNHKNIVLKISTSLVFVLSISLTIWGVVYLYQLSSYETKTDFSSLDSYTKEGNPYFHDTTNTLRENGNLVYKYIAEEELKEAWNERSELDYYDRSHSRVNVRTVLLRYMTSKGYRKDREHMNLLDSEDIKAIENGVPNYLYVNWPGILVRLHKTMAGLQKYRETDNPMESTFTQRIDLWKASHEAFKKKPVIGWGTGDILQAVEYGLEKNNSPLKGYREYKPHNQYMVYLLKLGIAGLIFFLLLYIYTAVKTRSYKIFPFNIFVVVFAFNMLGNNPIEAQFGLTMFVFFTLFFCFIYPKSINIKKPINTNNKN